jgi:hypothetical protein
MILRRVHLDALARAARETFVDRLVAHVASEFSAAYATRGEAGTRALCEQCLDAAADVSITTEAGVCGYLELWLRHGAMCDRASAELLAVLDDGGLGDEAKLGRLEALVG